MAIKMFSFLGANPYEECYYELNGRRSDFTSYIQRGLLDVFAGTNKFPETFCIFLTPDAERNNWSNRGGLREQISNKYTEIELRSCSISNGHDEDQLWELFSKIIQHIDENDEIIFDITSGFRSLPTLAMLVLHYARVTKNAHVSGVYYGNIEQLKNQHSVIRIKEIEKEYRIAPIIDLTSFAQMQDWITNVYSFIKTGRAEPLRDWNSQQSQLGNIQPFIDACSKLTSTLQTSQAPQVAKLARMSLQELINLKQEKEKTIYHPLMELYEQLEQRIAPLTKGDEIDQGISAAQWCYNHGLIQQAYTIINELSVTLVAKLLDKEVVGRISPIKKLREHAGDVLNNAVFKTKNKNWNFRRGKEYKDQKIKLLDRLCLYPQFLNLFDQFRDERNILNHAGYQDEIESDYFFIQMRNSFGEYCQQIKFVWDKEKKTEPILVS